jgi:hypothetical protein
VAAPATADAPATITADAADTAAVAADTGAPATITADTGDDHGRRCGAHPPAFAVSAK